MFRRSQTDWLPFTLLVLAASSTWAQPAPPMSHGGVVHMPTVTPGVPAAIPSVNGSTSLAQAFRASWQRQPEAQSQQVRAEAAAARKNSADSWTAEPVSLEFSTRTDRLNRNQGGREVVAGVTVPLWLPGERSRMGAVADAEMRLIASRVRAAQLRTAGSVRDSYWLWHRARVEHDLARERLAGAQQIAADVARRVKAGDLARADQHQADGAMASAEVSLAEAVSVFAGATQRLRAQTGNTPVAQATAMVQEELAPDVSVDPDALNRRHPVISEWSDRLEAARRAVELAQVQTRASPELSFAATRDRGQFGDAYQQSLTVGLRMPLGADSRNQARLATAQADAIEAETQLRLEQEQVLIGVEAARVQLDSARTQLTASDRRSQLARELRTFIQKSFRLGETDLPTRLRIELEAIDAERQAARARIELAASISALRQALGLLPE